jgi:hypothetical protein
MPEMDFPNDKTPGELPPVASVGPGKNPAPAKKRRFTRALVLKILGAGVLLLVLLVLAAPTLIGSWPIKPIIMGQVNNRVNGKVEVQSLSLGWFSGIKVTGVRVMNAEGAQIAELDHLVIPFPLRRVFSGNYALGDVLIDRLSFDARYDAQGQLNFSQLVKPGPTTPASPEPASAAATADAKPSLLPELSGNIKLTNCHGTITHAGKPTLYLTQLNGEVKIPNINAPITDQLTATLKVGNEPEGSVAVSGTAAVISKNQVAIDVADVHQTIDAKGLDLQSIQPFLPPSIGLETLDGVVGIHLAADLSKGKDVGLDASIVASKPIAIGGQILQGDTFSTNTFDVQIPKLSGVFPDGVSQWQSGRIKVGTKDAPLLVKIDQGFVSMLVDASPQAILNVIANKKPGSDGNITLGSNFDLAAILPQLRHMIPPMSGTLIKKAGFNENFTLAMTPGKATLYDLTGTTQVLGTETVEGGAARQISINPISITVNATDVGTKGAMAMPGLQNMYLKISSTSANGLFEGQSLSDLHGDLTIDLNLLRDELAQFVDLKNCNFGGNIKATIKEQGQLAVAPYKGQAQFSLSGTDLKYSDATHPAITQKLVQVDASADLQGSAQNTVEKINWLLLTLKTGSAGAPALVSAGVNNALLSPSSPSVLDQVQAAHFQVYVPDVKRVIDLANTFSIPAPTPTPAAKPDPSAPKPLPPLEVLSGSITLGGDVSHDGSILKMNVSQIVAKDIALQRGKLKYDVKPVNATSLIAIQTCPGKTVSDQIRSIQVSQLAGDLGVATLSMPTPIVATNVATQPIVNGSVKLTGDLAGLTQLLSFVQVGTLNAYPYTGDLTAMENIHSNEKAIGLTGGLQIAGFHAYDNKGVTFSEDLVTINNDLMLTTEGGDHSLAINELSANMQSSGALKLVLKNGSIAHLLTRRNLNLAPTLDYDLAQLWPIIQPIMGDDYKTLKITGQFSKKFNVTGSYPANQPGTVAIKTLHADGDLSVASFDCDGLSLQNFIVPFTLDGGQLVTVYANPNPLGSNTASPAVANGGTLDLGNITLDLTQDPPRLSMPANKVLMAGVMINPLFAGTFLASFVDNPIFAEAKEATGKLDMTLIDCSDLPLGDLVTKAVSANTGKADLKFSLTNMNIGLQGLSQLGSALKTDYLTANIKDGTVSVANGISTQKISMVSGSFSLDFDGKTRLSDKAFIPLNLSIGPIGAVVDHAGVHDPNILRFLPDRVTLPVEGTVQHASFRIDKVLPKLIADASAKAALNGLTGGNNGDKSNPLGGLLNKLGGKKNK